MLLNLLATPLENIQKRTPQGLKACLCGDNFDAGDKSPAYRPSLSGIGSRLSKNRVCTNSQPTSRRFSGFVAM